MKSFEETGRDRFIEVKTTAYGKFTPFFVSRNEVEVSYERDRSYHLYRVFAFRKNPRLYSLNGPIEKACELEAIQFIGRIV